MEEIIDELVLLKERRENICKLVNKNLSSISKAQISTTTNVQRIMTKPINLLFE